MSTTTAWRVVRPRSLLNIFLVVQLLAAGILTAQEDDLIPDDSRDLHLLGHRRSCKSEPRKVG